MAKPSTGLSSREDLSIAFDIYGPLLSPQQHEALSLHLEEDLSLAEAGARMGVTRQVVHEYVKAGQAAMRDYEMRLKLVRRLGAQRKKLLELAAGARRLRCECLNLVSGGDSLAEQLEKLASSL